MTTGKVTQCDLVADIAFKPPAAAVRVIEYSLRGGACFAVSPPIFLSSLWGK